MFLNSDLLNQIKSRQWEGGGLPHPLFNVTCLKDTFLTFTGKPRKKQKILVDFSPYSDEIDCLIIVALDSISYDLFLLLMQGYKLDGCMPITTVFPTTSAVAWIAITTGTWPAENGIYGITFYAKEYSSIYSMYHRLRDMKMNYSSPPPNIDFKLLGRNLTTIMEDFSDAGWQCFLLRGTPIAMNSPAIKLQEAGANVIYVGDVELRNDPSLLVHRLILNSEDCITTRDTKSKLLIWLFADFDACIHNTENYFNVLKKAWDELMSWCFGINRNYQTRTGILFISDHGQVYQKPSTDLYQKFEDIVQDPRLCFVHRGGGGRAVYVYPHPSRASLVKKYLEEILEESATVVTKEQALRVDLFGHHPLSNPERIGKLIVIGKTPGFPAHSLNAHHEHGALSWQELVVPFAWKLPSPKS